MQIEWGEYKGKRLIVLGDGRFPFQFGKGKASLILEALEGEDKEKFLTMLKELTEGE